MAFATNSWIAVFLLFGSTSMVPAAQAAIEVESLLQQSSYPIAIEDGALKGPGAAFLASAAAGTQFVALGEAHNNREIPQFATALFRLLHEREGFEFLILEQDPVMMKRVSRPPAKGDLEAIRALARQYLKGFVFISDQELRLLAEVGALADSQAAVIWGCEQAFGVTHILDELRERAPTDEAREYVDARRRESAAAEAVRNLEKGHYIFDAQLAPVADELDRLFGGATDSRAAFLIQAIRKSDEIYGYYAAGDRGELPGYYSNNFVREEYMKTRCLAEYRAALERDGRPPKGLLKFGHWHLYRGLTPTRVPSLGHFMYDFARVNGLGFFSIAIVPFNPRNDYGAFAAHESSRYLKPFAPLAADGRWILVDLRPFREYPRRRALIAAAALEGEAADELAALVYGFDALLLLGGAEPATFEVTGVPY